MLITCASTIGYVFFNSKKLIALWCNDRVPGTPFSELYWNYFYEILFRLDDPELIINYSGCMEPDTQQSEGPEDDVDLDGAGHVLWAVGFHHIPDIRL